MSNVAGRWRRRVGGAVVAALLAAAFTLSGCSTFHERPGHRPFATSKAKKSREERKTSRNPLSGVGSLFKKEEPKLAQSPEEFVSMPRPEW